MSKEHAIRLQETIENHDTIIAALERGEKSATIKVDGMEHRWEAEYAHPEKGLQPVPDADIPDYVAQLKQSRAVAQAALVEATSGTETIASATLS